MNEKILNKFYEAWQYLYYHPKFKNKHGFEGFESALSIFVVKLNPATNEIDIKDKSKNTKVQIWLECGEYDHDEKEFDSWYHDTRLDCGADTFEEAIIKLADLVGQVYGGYPPEIEE